MTAPQREHTPPRFDRMEEYKALLSNLADVSARRQNANTVYVGLNTVFLTALGVFLSAHIGSWGGAIGTVIICAVVTPVNVFWLQTVGRYRRTTGVRYEYLREIEHEFRVLDGTRDDEKPIGLFLRLEQKKLHRSFHTQVELRLTIYLTCLYPLIAVAVVLLTYLAQAQYIRPLSF